MHQRTLAVTASIASEMNKLQRSILNITRVVSKYQNLEIRRNDFHQTFVSKRLRYWVSNSISKLLRRLKSSTARTFKPFEWVKVLPMYWLN